MRFIVAFIQAATLVFAVAFGIATSEPVITAGAQNINPRLGGHIVWSQGLLILILVNIALLIWQRRQDASIFLKRFFLAKGSALDLACCRIVIFGILLWKGTPDFTHWINQPESLVISPSGLGWMTNTVLFDPHYVELASRLLVPCLLMSALGILSGITVPFATILVLWLYALPHFDGKVDHGMHHLAWFAILLSFTRCSDTLSVNSLFRNVCQSRSPFHAPPDATHYALPVRIMWLLIGQLYFFPGFWKFWTVGIDWGRSGNMANHLYDKWIEIGHFEPVIAVHEYPLLLTAMGIGTLLFEMLFFVAIFNKYARCGVVVIGIAFHVGTYLFMGIFFRDLLLCYLVFVPWASIARAVYLTFRRETRDEENTPANVSINEKHGAAGRRQLLIAVAGAVLLVGNMVFGFRHDMDGWPLCCYPTFAHVGRGSLVVVRLTVVYDNGRSVEVDLREVFRDQGTYGALLVQNRIMTASNREELDSRVTDVWRRVQPSLSSTLPVKGLLLEAVKVGWPPESNQAVLNSRRFRIVGNSATRIVGR